MSYFRNISVAACLALGLSSGTANAVTFKYDFVFTNAQNDRGSTTRIWRGFFGNAPSSTSSLQARANSNGLRGGFLYRGSRASNNASTAMGSLNARWNFLFFSNRNALTEVVTGDDQLTSLLAPPAILTEPVDSPVSVFEPTSQDAAAPTESLTAIPLPAGGLLLLTGFGALMVFRQRKKPIAQA